MLRHTWIGRVVSVMPICLLLLCATSTYADDRVSANTATLLEHLLSNNQSWGELGINTCAHAPGVKPSPLRIGEQVYESGLGMHANGDALFALDGGFTRFEAEVGVQRQQQGVGTVVFQVFVDEDKVFDSGVMRESDAARPVSVSLDGADELRLAVLDAGDGIICDCANWVNPRLEPAPAETTRKETPRMDIGLFATVVSSDPARMDGVRASRVQPFPEDDLYLSTELLPNPDGAYAPTVYSDGRACIGLEWPEQRLLRQVSLTFRENSAMPLAEAVQLQLWAGESPWQGKWLPIEAEVQQEGRTFNWPINRRFADSLRNGTEKVRLIIPTGTAPLLVDRPSASSVSRRDEINLRFEIDPASPDTLASFEMYNGLIINPDGSESTTASLDLKSPGTLQLAKCRVHTRRTDQTMVRVRIGSHRFAVSVDDVLTTNAVYYPDTGFMATTADNPVSLAAYKSEIAGRKTILEQVRLMPDQNLAQAFAHVHNPVQNKGPMMLSLACDNRKFVVDRTGRVSFEPYDTPDQEVPQPDAYRFAIQPRLGEATEADITRNLDGGWLPSPVLIAVSGGIRYTHTARVVPVGPDPLAGSEGWLYAQAVCVIDLTAENTGDAPRDACVQCTPVAPQNAAITMQPNGEALVINAGSRLLASFRNKARPMAISQNNEAWFWRGQLQPGERVEASILLPAWSAEAPSLDALAADALTADALRVYWDHVLQSAAHILTPDLLLNDIIRASMVHCLLAARNENQGRYVAAWIASDRYGPLESEAHAVIRGMDMLGMHAYARRSLEFFIKRYAPEGYLTTGYTLIGAGWHLWTLAEHYRRTGDDLWMRDVAPDVARAARWISTERKKTQRPGLEGRVRPESGLIPPGVSADWNRFAYRFYQSAHFSTGLTESASALSSIQFPGASDLVADAAAFRQDVLRAYNWTRDRSPLLPLANGAWTAAYPSILFYFGRLEDIFNEDWSRSWAYDVELGAHHLAAQGIMDPNAAETGAMLDHMEDFWFLHAGMGDYPEEKNHQDWFNLGGFAKIQPYYARNAELYAMRDDVKPFLRSYFNTIPTLLSLENLSFWEHFHNTGAWNKTHETGYFLSQTHNMFAIERDGALWLAPLTPEDWLADGKTIQAQNLPTSFGRTGFTMDSHIAQGYIDLTIDQPDRSRPDALIVRLRTPGGLTPVSIEPDGAAQLLPDPYGGAIRVLSTDRALRLRVKYPCDAKDAKSS